MADFSQFLRKPAGEHKRPPLLPAADYPGIIRGFELGDNNKNKTPYVRLQLGFTAWGATVPDTWEVFDTATQRTVTVGKSDVDLSKRQMRRDFFLTEDALWRLDELIRSCGITSEGHAYEEILPQLQGAAVLIEVQKGINQDTSEEFNQVGKVVGAR